MNTPLTVEFDVTHGTPVDRDLGHGVLFSHNQNLDVKIHGDRVDLTTGWPEVRGHFYVANVAHAGRRMQIAATVSSESLRLFIDGRLVKWKDSLKPETLTTSKPLFIGRPLGGGDSFTFKGMVHRVRISRGEQYDQSYSPKAEWQPDESTLAMYDFRTVDPGAKAQDLSSKGNHGKIVGATWAPIFGEATTDKAKPAAPAANRFALQFDADDYVRVRNVNWERFENYTVEAFVTPERTSERVGFVVLQLRNTSIALNRRETTGGWFLSYRHADKELPEYLYSQAPAEMNRRVHLAGVVSGKQSRLYVDGKLAGTTTAQRERAGAPGDNYDIGNNFFGTIDGIRLSKAARYEAPFAPPSRLEKNDATLALYRFAEGAGEYLMDSSGNGHHGQIVGAKWNPLMQLSTEASAVPSN